MSYFLSILIFAFSLIYASFTISTLVVDRKIDNLKKESIVISYDTKDQVIESGDYIITIRKK